MADDEPKSTRKRNPEPAFHGINLHSIPLYGAIALTVCGWAAYLIDSRLHVDLFAFLRSSQPRSRDDPSIETEYLIFAIAFTVLALPWGIYQTKKSRDLATRGKRTTGTISAKSPLRKRGLVPTTVVFTIEGTEYKVRHDLRDEKYAVGQSVKVLYDPQNPKRCEIQ